MKRFMSITLASLLAGCAGAHAGSTSDADAAGITATDANAAPDASAAPADASGSTDAASCVAQSGPLTLTVIDLPGCDGLAPGTEDCHARVYWDPSAWCAGSPCDRLLVYWSGGEQSCDDGNYDPLIQKWAQSG
jgi:hypothetical protein